MVQQLRCFAGEVTRVSRLGGQAVVEGAKGAWRQLTDVVNTLTANLFEQLRAIAGVTKSISRGDLSQNGPLLSCPHCKPFLWARLVCQKDEAFFGSSPMLEDINWADCVCPTAKEVATLTVEMADASPNPICPPPHVSLSTLFTP
ncbi:hypothetical protein PtA15_11A613 [Puccinia triticina]|uniref:CxC1-like cysteine cluster associated with KDZ transposases domain-containing protein n=1 Tax=Puccinia triticina TaxID=208348 RepID=A0ABY7D0N4_9BASI|nr:uncharacterized protein PtA15_11A613 [Puccinia triticina]WAQ89921.1 hypothetical protein PtA15_11A613 [Puccinia triticina]